MNETLYKFNLAKEAIDAALTELNGIRQDDLTKAEQKIKRILNTAKDAIDEVWT